jgi:hypothetical protein
MTTLIFSREYDDDDDYDDDSETNSTHDDAFLSSLKRSAI